MYEIKKKICKHCLLEKEIFSFSKTTRKTREGIRTRRMDVCYACRYGHMIDHSRFTWKNKTDEQRLEHIKELYERYVIKKDGCWDWSGYKSAFGYGILNVFYTHHNAQRVSWMIHKGTIPNKLLVLHKCDNPSCSNPEHLFLGTHKDNQDDMENKGRARQLKGSECPWAKLTEENVREIKSLLTQRYTILSLAKKFSVSRSVISSIKRGLAWRHIS